MNPDYQEALKFLKHIQPEGPWNLVAIAVDGPGITGITFMPEDEKGLLRWLEAHGDRNIYYTLNKIAYPINKKPTRGDIKEMGWLHVDLDPRAREDVKTEQARLEKLVDAMGQKPTVVVFSGGGLQCLWRLKEPFTIDGKEELFEEAKLYNLQLELIYDADNCHNVDRIMRLPGTVNHPDKRKREKGREPALARVVAYNNTVFDLSEFTKAPQVQSADKGLTKNSVQVSGNVQRLDSLDSLPVGPLCRTVIAKGLDPDEPGKWSSRSEPLWWVVCEMTREGVDAETIYAIITDPDWSISGHVLAQSRPHDYAIRQIERAQDEAIDPVLCELNDKYAVVQLGGQTKILKEDIVPFNQHEDRPVVQYMNWTDFTNYFANRFITIANPNTTTVAQIPVGKWWLMHPQRRTYDGVVFLPGKTVADRYNLWKGFGFEARPGSCDLFLGHIRDNICQGNQEWTDFLVGWMARLVQRPDLPGEVALVFRGKQGTGKGFFANQFGKLLGRHYLPVRDSGHIFGRFNSHLRECVLLFADEAFWAGNKKQEGMLKSLITEDTIMSEGKGLDAQPMPNYIHLIMASNEAWVVPVGDFDRRFFVLDVGDDRRKDRAYFTKIVEELEAGGYEALLHYLLSYDLKDYDVSNVPVTEAHAEQKQFTMCGDQEWWFNKLQDGRIFARDEDWSAERVWATELCNDFIDYTNQWDRGFKSNSTRLGIFLRKVFPSGYDREQAAGQHSVMQASGEMQMITRPYFYTIPSLDECRAHWDATFGTTTKWSKPSKPVDLGEHDTTEENF